MTSIGKDLATIRKHQGLTLEEMNQNTRIPLETLQRIENDTLLEEDGSNRIYARGFIRTYARALKVDDESILHSLDQYEIGNYNGLLLESFPKLKPLEKSPDKKDIKNRETSGKTGITASEDKSDKEKNAGGIKTSETGKPGKEQPRKSPKQPAGKSTASSAPASTGTAMNDSSVDRYNWAQVGGRLKSNNRKTSPLLIGIVIIILILFAAIYLIYNSENMSLSSYVPGTEEVTSPTADEPDGGGLSLDLDVDATVTEEVPDAPTAELDDTLYLTLYAAYDRLEPVRVYSDLKPRLDPYWVEQGAAFNFEFQDTIRVSGQYNRMLLFLNGHRIENFRQNYYNQEAGAVELTRDMFTDDPEWANQVPLDLPEGVAEPDSVRLRPFF